MVDDLRAGDFEVETCWALFNEKFEGYFLSLTCFMSLVKGQLWSFSNENSVYFFIKKI